MHLGSSMRVGIGQYNHEGTQKGGLSSSGMGKVFPSQVKRQETWSGQCDGGGQDHLYLLATG